LDLDLAHIAQAMLLAGGTLEFHQCPSTLRTVGLGAGHELRVLHLQHVSLAIIKDLQVVVVYPPKSV
jgi:hypothetical protein